MRTATLNIKEDPEASAGVAILRCSGGISFQTYEVLHRKLHEHFNAGHYKIVVDLSEIEYVCSVGAGCLLSAASTAHEHAGGGVVLLSPRPAVGRVFDMLGFCELSHTFADLSGALAFFQHIAS